MQNCTADSKSARGFISSETHYCPFRGGQYFLTPIHYICLVMCCPQGASYFESKAVISCLDMATLPNGAFLWWDKHIADSKYCSLHVNNYMLCFSVSGKAKNNWNRYFVYMQRRQINFACAVEEESVRVRKDSAWRRRFQQELQESDSGRDSARDIDTDTTQPPRGNGR
jgi:hypothetical protein